MGLTNASKIPEIINEIANVKIATFKNEFKCTYNSKPIVEVKDDLFTDKFDEFNSLLENQLQVNCDIHLLKKYLSEAKSSHDKIEDIIQRNRPRGGSGVIDIKDETRDNIFDKLTLIRKSLSKMITVLENEIEYFDYKDVKKDITENKSTKQLDNKVYDKVTISFGKKESLMLIYVMEKSGIIKFKDDNHRKEFIENNFAYTETRDNENKGGTFPMIEISSDISILKGSQHKSTNNKTLEKLIKRLEETFFKYNF